jgi:hypothetical protein
MPLLEALQSEEDDIFESATSAAAGSLRNLDEAIARVGVSGWPDARLPMPTPVIPPLALAHARPSRPAGAPSALRCFRLNGRRLWGIGGRAQAAPRGAFQKSISGPRRAAGAPCNAPEVTRRVLRWRGCGAAPLLTAGPGAWAVRAGPLALALTPTAALGPPHSRPHQRKILTRSAGHKASKIDCPRG